MHTRKNYGKRTPLRTRLAHGNEQAPRRHKLPMHSFVLRSSCGVRFLCNGIAFPLAQSCSLRPALCSAICPARERTLGPAFHALLGDEVREVSLPACAGRGGESTTTKRVACQTLTWPTTLMELLGQGAG